MRNLILATALSLSACTGDGPRIPANPRQLAGSFGGDHVALQLSPQGGTLKFDCASGTVGPITPRGGGNFAASGTFSPGHGGPDRVGEVIVPRAVLFTGQIDGVSLSMTGKLSDGSMIGPFIMIRDAPPTIYRCL